MVDQQYENAAIAAAFAVGTDAVEYLGTGSFGETWRIQEASGKVTASKIIYSDEFPAERIEREIDGLRRVQHPRVVNLLEHTELVIDGETRPVLRFEYVPGGDLQHALATGHRGTANEVSALLRGLLEAAQALHEANVVHRDIKPGNIALRNGAIAEPVLLDLGLAKPLDMSSMTTYPRWIGSPRYMAPEQVMGDRARNAADLWSIGVVTAEVAAGRHPYWSAEIGNDISGWIRAQENLVVELPASLPAPVATVITKLLSFRKGQRGSARSALAMLDKV